MADIQTPQYLGIILAMVFSAFFSGVEMAFVSSNKLYFELKAKQNILSAKIIANFNQSPSQFIGTMLIGNTLSLVAYGIFMEEFLHHLILANFPFFTNEIVARKITIKAKNESANNQPAWLVASSSSIRMRLRATIYFLGCLS